MDNTRATPNYQNYNGAAVNYSTIPSNRLSHNTSLYELQCSLPAQTRSYRGQSAAAYSKRHHLNPDSVISQRVVEHEIKIPKKIVREEVIEKVVVVPERVVTEHVIEEVQKVREKIIEIAKPFIKEKIVEVPDIVYVEKVIEVPEKVYKEKIREVPVVTYQERRVEVPKIVRQEKIVEIPEIEYRDVPVEKIVEVPEIREQFVMKEIPVPQYVEKLIPEYVQVEVPQDVVRHIPVPVEATTTFKYNLPQLKPKYNKVDLNVYIPRFIEIPIPAEFLDQNTIAQAEDYINQVSSIASQQAPSLCEIENIAGNLKNSGIAQIVQNSHHENAFADAWRKGRIQLDYHRYPSNTSISRTVSRPLSHKEKTLKRSTRKRNLQRHRS